MSDDNQPIKTLRDDASEAQLTPIKTPHSNAVLRAPEGAEGDVGDLHCELAVDPGYQSVVTVSAWDLDDHQRELIAAGAHVRMSVWQHPIPPLALAIEAPFCPNDGAQTVFVRSVKAFCCPACDPRFPGNGGGSSNGSRLVLPPGVTPLDRAREDFEPGGAE